MPPQIRKRPTARIKNTIAAIELPTAIAWGVVSGRGPGSGIRNGSPQPGHLVAGESTTFPHIRHLVAASDMYVILPRREESGKAVSTNRTARAMNGG
jgi:hypothetical protein